MSRYTSLVRCLALGVTCLWLLLGASPVWAVRTGEIIKEAVRTEQRDRRVVQVWWLPVEYWEAAARELSWPEEEIRDVRERFAVYTIIGVLDARIAESHEFDFRDHVHLAERLGPVRDGARLEALRRWDPVVTKKLPDLTYLLRGSLGPFSSGLRILLYPNIGANGKPEFSASGRETLHVRYAIADGQPLDFFWHAPFTAIAGAKRNPATGELYDASWKFNPWTGDKLP